MHHACVIPDICRPTRIVMFVFFLELNRFISGGLLSMSLDEGQILRDASGARVCPTMPMLIVDSFR